jgi:hypothetical protein
MFRYAPPLIKRWRRGGMIDFKEAMIKVTHRWGTVLMPDGGMRKTR